jgi:hypothetical protein
MSTFEAKYSGYCHAECGQRIEVGDLATYRDNELIHADCADRQVRDERSVAICRSCWLVQPCDCEGHP